MKILFLTPWYPDERHPNHGIFVRDQALLINRGHEVWVVSAKIDYTGFGVSSLRRTDSVFQGLKESRMLVKKSIPIYNQFNFFLLITKETCRIAKNFRPDIIHGNIGYPGSFWSWMVSRLLNIPFIVTEHTRISNNFRSPVHKALTLFGLRRASARIGVSRWHADEITSVTGKGTIVIPNVIRFEKYPGVRVAPDTREFQIGFLGGLETPVKGLDLLLRAAAVISGEYRLHIAGAGALMKDYIRMAKELGIYHRCIFYGSIPHDEVNSFMHKLHFFVNASRWETFGIAMVEAMACGLPVVATDNGGSKEFITADNGLLVAWKEKDLADAIEAMMRQFEMYRPEDIRNSIITKFSPASFLERMNKVYESVTATPGPNRSPDMVR